MRLFLGQGAFCAIALVAMASTGCNPLNTQQPDDAPLSQAPTNNHDSSPTLHFGDKSTFESMLSENRGHVILVDFWATWCVPCIQQFPHTVDLGQRYRDQGLRVVAVSMNEPNDRNKVMDFLKRSNAGGVSSLLTEYGAGSAFVEAFDLRGDIPFYRLYDRRGQLRYSFSDDPEGIEQCESIERMDERIQQLLSEETLPSPLNAN
jgi:thiol-disulfide isomerase/thioredoxin